MQDVKIMSMNTRGLRDFEKRKEVFQYIKDKEFDIILLQETHSSDEIESLWSCQWGSKIYFSNKTSNSAGVAILLNPSKNINVTNYTRDNRGRMIAIEVEISEYKWVIANFYGPNDDDAKFYIEAWSLLELLDNDNIIYGGDFNMNLEPCDKCGIFEVTKKREMLKEYMSEKDLVDVWRLLHPDSFQFTWRRI